MPTYPKPDPADIRPLQSSRRDMDTAFTSAEFAHRCHWEAMLDAGLIGNRVEAAPGVAAIRDANDRLFRARRHRALQFG